MALIYFAILSAILAVLNTTLAIAKRASRNVPQDAALDRFERGRIAAAGTCLLVTINAIIFQAIYYAVGG